MKVLVADDSLVMRRLLEATLQGWGYEVVCARDGAEAWAVLEAADAPELAILDWMMPAYSGVELCRKVRSLERSKYTYVILLTSKGQREDIVEGLGAGADDYVVKPFDRHEMEVRLRAGRRIIDLQTQLMEAQEALREQATHDALTGVLNRATVMQELGREVARAVRSKAAVGVIMMDLDHFKQVNDRYGHQAGDAVLAEVAGRVRASLRPYDSFGRYGGEEFVLVAPGCSGQDLAAQAERLRRKIVEAPIRAGEVDLVMTSSFGASAIEAGGSATAEELIRAADEALYRAKDEGRNRVEYAEPAAVRRMRG